MFRLLLIAVVIAVPGYAFAQANTSAGSTSAARPGPTKNLSNPQAQANMGGQPSIAQTVPSDGDAHETPTPTLGGSGMSKVPQPQKPPVSGIIR